MMESWVWDTLACPSDHLSLRRKGDELVCDHKHTYPVFDGTPILLRRDVAATHSTFEHTAYALEHPETLAVESADGIDPFVQEIIAATGGYLYKPLINNLTRYPIPELRLPDANGERFLELGCSWGRWCISAAYKGYSVVGVEPSLYAVRAAGRVARQLGVEASYLVADARYLPFCNQSFDTVFSYSVLQHLAKPEVERALCESGRVLANDGLCMVQLPNVYGARNLYIQAKRGFRDARDFEVRYWTPAELRQTFTRCIGKTEVSVDGFFSLNAQQTDADMLPWRYRLVIKTSDTLREASERVRWLGNFADSLYVSARPGAD